VSGRILLPHDYWHQDLVDALSVTKRTQGSASGYVTVTAFGTRSAPASRPLAGKSRAAPATRLARLTEKEKQALAVRRMNALEPLTREEWLERLRLRLHIRRRETRLSASHWRLDEPGLWTRFIEQAIREITEKAPPQSKPRWAGKTIKPDAPRVFGLACAACGEVSNTVVFGDDLQARCMKCAPPLRKPGKQDARRFPRPPRRLALFPALKTESACWEVCAWCGAAPPARSRLLFGAHGRMWCTECAGHEFEPAKRARGAPLPHMADSDMPLWFDWWPHHGRYFDEVRADAGHIALSDRELSRLWRYAWMRGEAVAPLRLPRHRHGFASVDEDDSPLPVCRTILEVERFREQCADPFGDASLYDVDGGLLALWEDLDIVGSTAADPLTRHISAAIDVFGQTGVSVLRRGPKRGLTAQRALNLLKKPVPVRRIKSSAREVAALRWGAARPPENWEARLVHAVLHLLRTTPVPPARAEGCKGTLSPLFGKTATEIAGCLVPSYVTSGVVAWLWRRLTAKRGGRGRVGVKRACDLLRSPRMLAAVIDDRFAAVQIEVECKAAKEPCQKSEFRGGLIRVKRSCRKAVSF
jgi:hypothetical protein